MSEAGKSWTTLEGYGGESPGLHSKVTGCFTCSYSVTVPLLTITYVQARSDTRAKRPDPRTFPGLNPPDLPRTSDLLGNNRANPSRLLQPCLKWQGLFPLSLLPLRPLPSPSFAHLPPSCPLRRRRTQSAASMRSSARKWLMCKRR